MSVSIITATYNRSNVLAYAINSVLRSTYEDWELIVVGDACTDDTESVVNAFGDPRIQFYNLEENFGEQSGPNNIGFSLARGEYIAYLNHDDLYFPDHLKVGLDLIESAEADFVHSAALRSHSVQKPGEDGSTLLTLHAVSNSHQYNPMVSAPASTWLVSRKLIERVGPWKPATQCFGAPSQEWLYRAWAKKSQMLFTGRATVLIIPSGIRANDYANWM